MKVTIDGREFAPVDEAEAADLAERLRNFKLESTDFWREKFIEFDTKPGGTGRYGMYRDGDEDMPFFSEKFLYNLLGKDEARSVLGIVRGLCVLAGVKWR